MSPVGAMAEEARRQERMAQEKKLPYVNAYGNIKKALEKIQAASTPPRFTHDFLATKLGMSGGSARPVVPFLKRIGFIGSDGSPTDLYKQFRGTDSERGAAAAEGLKRGYAPLYEVNEYAHDLSEPALKSLIVQVTGEGKQSSTVNLIAKSFRALDEFADHDAPGVTVAEPEQRQADEPETNEDGSRPPALGLNYTINLQLPATSDIAVFNAIFKSLREHLLR
jgi:Family of unknown function (DUF5343)